MRLQGRSLRLLELELFYGSRTPVGVLVYLELRPTIAAYVMPR